MKLVALVAFAILAGTGSARAEDDPFWDEWAKYLQRKDTITVDGGNARQVNAITHIIDPWPRYAFDRRIPANGQRMVRAIERYQNPQRLGIATPTLAPIIVPTLGATGGGGAGTGVGGYGGGQ